MRHVKRGFCAGRILFVQARLSVQSPAEPTEPTVEKQLDQIDDRAYRDDELTQEKSKGGMPMGLQGGLGLAGRIANALWQAGTLKSSALDAEPIIRRLLESEKSKGGDAICPAGISSPTAMSTNRGTHRAGSEENECVKGQYKEPTKITHDLVREDGRLERLCEHGIGHTVGHLDPSKLKLDYIWVHGCDGCCKNYEKMQGA